MHITGGLFIRAWNSDAVRGSLHSASLHGLPVEVLTPAETLRRFPAFHLGQDEAAVYEANAGFVRPERAIAANLALATRYGAELHFNEPVLRWEGTSTGAVRVTTADGAYEAAKLVLAPGAWAPDIFSGSELPLVVRRHVMAWFDPPGGLDLLLPGRFPIYFWQSAADRIFYGFPAIDGPCGGAKVAIHTGVTCAHPRQSTALSPPRTSRSFASSSLRAFRRSTDACLLPAPACTRSRRMSTLS